MLPRCWVKSPPVTEHPLAPRARLPCRHGQSVPYLCVWAPAIAPLGSRPAVRLDWAPAVPC
eukprot:2213268-Pyramimonas_sp.AAC.1